MRYQRGNPQGKPLRFLSYFMHVPVKIKQSTSVTTNCFSDEQPKFNLIDVQRSFDYNGFWGGRTLLVRPYAKY